MRPLACPLASSQSARFSNWRAGFWELSAMTLLPPGRVL